MMRLIEFECRGQRLALPLACVRRAVPCAEPAPLPGAGAIVLGVLNVAGEMVVVVDVGRRLGLAPAPLDPAQQILVAELSGFLAGIVVDRIHGVTERDPAQLFPGEVGAAPYVAGMVRLEDGLCLVVEPGRFLFADECASLSGALAGAAHGGIHAPA
ncbi:chemotaxis protein CheW [Massilia sp. ST3]|uniref:chemotaxis protein CheW n=1 Tax=Massilia sp. ST3 TaxID=2824903 RepID=UPI001B80EAEB|nr:chemotaxis protein CheW [Massilia sp. ST3]MBQ5946020.1 chemotaxis protein CheW [Massilia sp. ST3]